MPQDPLWDLPGWLRDWRLDLGRRIREERLHANLSQEALGHRLDVDRNTVARWELAITSPPLGRLFGIAHELGIPPARLMPGGPRPPGDE
ncbi:helix-turn-helix domain-containing protein [Streptomyces klenkii]|uniref:helix-turn-helix domain-containing protein n=1 Tax=Streptomyces klenkii TaxID=1420899 RepID=UPI001319FCC9|nr:helix-turn-helix transcriptional regulator [Streptomyces klenkii]